MSKTPSPERVRVMMVPREDQASFNTISKPFKDVFDDTVLLVPRAPHERHMPIFGRRYRIRVIEALAGMWLSRVMWYIRGDASAAYEPTLLGLLDRDLASGLQRHGVIGTGNVPNFPDLYQQGNVPGDYDEAAFNPDAIYPGQRFIMIDVLPTEQLDFDDGIVITVPRQDFWQSAWLGIVWGAKADLGFGGAHDAVGGVVNVGDMVRYGQVRRFAGLRVRGWRFGVGAGASSGATLIVFANYPTLESLNMYSDDGFDWSIALGVSLPKGSSDLAQRAFSYAKSFKIIKAYEATGKRGELIMSAVQAIIQNTKGGIPSGTAPFMITLPVPFTGPGKHLWAGGSVSRYETFEVNAFRPDAPPN